MLFLPAWSLFLSSLRQTNVDEWSSYGKQSDKAFGAEVVGHEISAEDDRQSLVGREQDQGRSILMPLTLTFATILEYVVDASSIPVLRVA